MTIKTAEVRGKESDVQKKAKLPKKTAKKHYHKYENDEDRYVVDLKCYILDLHKNDIFRAEKEKWV